MLCCLRMQCRQPCVHDPSRTTSAIHNINTLSLHRSQSKVRTAALLLVADILDGPGVADRSLYDEAASSAPSSTGASSAACNRSTPSVAGANTAATSRARDPRRLPSGRASSSTWAGGDAGSLSRPPSMTRIGSSGPVSVPASVKRSSCSPPRKDPFEVGTSPASSTDTIGRHYGWIPKVSRTRPLVSTNTKLTYLATRKYRPVQ